MSKRVISIFLCCALCAGFLILPASAVSFTDVESITPSGTEYVNYIFSDSYSYYESYWYSTDSLSHYYKNLVGKVGFKWNVSNVDVGTHMLLAIKAARLPDAVSVQVGYDSGSATIIASVEGHFPLTSSLNVYIYRVSMEDVSRDSLTSITIWGRYDSSYTGSVSIASCFGVKNYLSVYDRAEFTFVPIERRTEGEYSLGLYGGDTTMFPYTAPSWLNDSSYNITRVDFNLRCDGDRFNSPAVGNVYLLLNTFCEQITATVSLVAKDTSVRDVKNINVSIDKDSSWSLVNQYEVSGLGALYNNAAYQLSFDLTGYDMSNYDLQIFVSVENVPAVIEGGIDHKLFGLTFRSMTYVPNLLSDPWYKPFATFFDRVGDNIQSAISNVLGSLTNFKNLVSNAFSDLEETLRDLLGSTPDQEAQVDSSIQQNQQQLEQVQDQGESMKDQIEDIEQAENEILQIPEIDPADLNINTLIPADGMTMMTNVMVTITNNHYVAQLLLLVVCLALVAVMVF